MTQADTSGVRGDGSPESPGASSARADVLAALRRYNEAMRGSDVDGQLGFFAATWSGGKQASRAALRKSLEAQAGESRQKQFALDDADVRVDGDTALVDNVPLNSPAGNGTFQFRMVREADGVWRCESFGLSPSINAAAAQARGLRERVLRDPHRPGYHFVNPEGVAMPFDPNGAIHWNGRYHLFYLSGCRVRRQRRPLGPCVER